MLRSEERLARCPGSRNRPHHIHNEAVRKPAAVRNAAYVDEQQQRRYGYGKRAPEYPRTEFAVLAGSASVDKSADYRVVDGVEYLCDDDNDCPVLGREPHALRHIEHEVGAYKLETHVATEVAEQISNFVSYAERSLFLFLFRHTHGICSHNSSSERLFFSERAAARSAGYKLFRFGFEFTSWVSC